MPTFTLFPRGRRQWIRSLSVVLGFILLLFVGGCCMMSMPGRSHEGPLPPLTPEEAGLRDRLAAHVRKLAAEIGERNVENPAALAAAAKYLEQALKDMGYAVATQPFEAAGVTVRNIEVERRGAARAGEIVVVGGHYDSVTGCPGANDNATGAAAVVEIARDFASRTPARTVRFVLFVNEEPPWFQTDRMGSVVYARRCRERGENIVGMLSLETMGYYADAPGTQDYPFPLSLFYPDTGNVIAFVGNVSSRSWVRRCIQSFRGHTAFPSEGAALPGWIAGVGWSDHWSFWEEGVPALEVTDTAPFRYAHYHSHQDTPEKVDFDRLARVTAGIARVVGEVAEE
jgi:hypothetical protein